MNETPEIPTPTPIFGPLAGRWTRRGFFGGCNGLVDIAALSQGVKEGLMARADRLALKAMSMAEDKVDQGEAKSFDQAMRGVHSVERIRSSAVNEPKKVEMVGSVQMSQSETNQLSVDLLEYWRDLGAEDPKHLISSLDGTIARLRERESATGRPLSLPPAAS